MYHVTFPAQSNRASWAFVGLITDMADDPVDLTGMAMTFAVKDKNGTPYLTASTDNGKMTFLDDMGKFRWFFTTTEMRGLCAGTYNTGLTLTNTDASQTIQLSVGPLPIIDGVVP